MCENPETYVQVQYDFEYEASDGKKVSIKEGEEYLLLKKTNNDWWQVIRDGERKPFYLPASYVEEITSDKRKNKVQKVVANCLSIKDKKVHSHSTGTLSEQKQPKEVSSYINKSKSYERIDKLCLTRPQGLTFNNPLYSLGEDDTTNNKPYFEPEVDYTDTETEDEENEVQNLNFRNHHNCASIPIKKSHHDKHKNNDESHSSLENSSLQTPTGTSPIYANFPLNTSIQPPSPTEKDSPTKILLNHWAEYEDENGRKYYYNRISREKSWKPPRRRSDSKLSNSSISSKESYRLDDSSRDSIESHNQSPVVPCNPSASLPLGWSQGYDDETGESFFINDITKVKWFTSMDEQGRVYYYQENAQESFWQLPEVIITEVESEQGDTTSTPNVNSVVERKTTPALSPVRSPTIRRTPNIRPSSLANRGIKTRSMVLTDARSSTLPRNLSGPQWPIIHGGQLDSDFSVDFSKTTRQGMLNKTKLIEGGKKLRKNWSTSFIVLSDIFLLFYKDMKSAQMKNGSPHTKPEISIDLAGALIDWTPDKSSRKNVFQISTVFGLQVLLQDDNEQTSKEWFDAIRTAISKLPSGFNINAIKQQQNNGGEGDLPSPDDSKKSFRFSRKFRSSGSTEDLGSTSAERKMRIRDKLLNFFLRRPTMESLREKGIIKEEPVFGCNLSSLCAREKTNIPVFVKMCIATIEKKDMKADGLYRASGNLSQVQKIRFQVNQDRMNCLDDEEDVHVLTGALKMFFRELKEPLIPFNTFEKFLAAIMLPDPLSKLHTFEELILSLPRENYDTLRFLLKHLLRVTEFSEFNRMHVQNLAIVFGPTLMWPEMESTNMALDMMHQNQIIEFLLLEFSAIFR